MREEEILINPLKKDEKKEGKKDKKRAAEKKLARLPFWWKYCLAVTAVNVILIVLSFFWNKTMYAAPAVILLEIPMYFGWVDSCGLKLHKSTKAFFEAIPSWALFLALAAAAYCVCGTIANAKGLQDGYGVMEEGQYFLTHNKSKFPITKHDFDILEASMCRLICGIPSIFLSLPLCFFTAAKRRK